ncbi:hypothetical protein [Clostridium thermosuccinogenes]|uniref:hypothetical protein n=1 Tax=Clostridium thermosuccinogenes TaxID=84032 RepID=UPI00137472FC|nr:hypothetical protein [Pseudoclostridium thermosuccinogenes]
MRFANFINRISTQMLNTFPFRRNEMRDKSNAEKELEAIMERYAKEEGKKRN